MADKLTLRPSGSLESKLSSSVDSAASDTFPTERPDFFSGVRKGIKKLGSISTGPRPGQHSNNERLYSSTLDSHNISGSERHQPPRKGHVRSTSDLGKPLPATPASPTVKQLLRAPFSPPYTPQVALGTARQPINDSRTSTMDSTTSGASSIYTAFKSTGNLGDLTRSDTEEDIKEEITTPKSNGPSSAAPSPGPASRSSGNGVAGTSGGPSQHLSGLMCNVHRTTGQEPYPLVGATTTILGDKLYVFGGRILSRTRPVLTSDLYELDLIRRHWVRISTFGDIPPPRYFHSLCPLGDNKLICYGGMSPAPSQLQYGLMKSNVDTQSEVVVMSDIHMYDVPTRKWTFIPCGDAPQGRYAHCATILPSSTISLTLNTSSPSNKSNSNDDIDLYGGAEMVVVGGQDSTNHYIEQISVFNFRMMRWTSTQQLGKSCGAYRSVVAPLTRKTSEDLGASSPAKSDTNTSQETKDAGSSMLIYSNYNFLDVKLELQIRAPDGTLTEKLMQGTFSPPGLRFPNGGIINTNFVVSGTYLTSSKQEYALWALDLRTLTWSRIDAGGSVFSQGSWNRGVLWNRRNTYVILGNRKRSLVEDYNHRRINFTNICTVELEAFGLYDNPRKVSPMSGFVSASYPFSAASTKFISKTGWSVGGRPLSKAAEELGQAALGLRELSDMDILCVNGERIPANSRIIAKRWGPYFIQLLREGSITQDASDAATLRPENMTSSKNRNSNITITPRNGRYLNKASTGHNRSIDISNLLNPPDPNSLSPTARPRTLYLPHTKPTVQALLHFIYNSTLPSSSSSLCTPQILCSLLQIARPYKVDGLLEAVVERLHGVLDSRNAAAVFNASAMAAGGGPSTFVAEHWSLNDLQGTPGFESCDVDSSTVYDSGGQGLVINTGSGGYGRAYDDDDPGSATESVHSDMSGSNISSNSGRPVWDGSVSTVIGLQKRGLRGLMEGRRLRERGGSIGIRDGQGKVGLGLGIAD
ncbi:BgTH12-06251 [Blumeria graminis f. sp. triticale]|uniref:BgTH12-06251 n=1 Tax=Blumeria graminis f. sp. triticale TaxID=1689686 RepID=A0A9W4GDB0_BLUGR|nr:BgTH12-06251 [Blumeria graminis f. sp. triticale]